MAFRYVKAIVTLIAVGSVAPISIALASAPGAPVLIVDPDSPPSEASLKAALSAAAATITITTIAAGKVVTVLWHTLGNAAPAFVLAEHGTSTVVGTQTPTITFESVEPATTANFQNVVVGFLAGAAATQMFGPKS